MPNNIPYSFITQLLSFVGGAMVVWPIVNFFLKRKYKRKDKKNEIYSNILDLLQKIDLDTAQLFYNQNILEDKNKIIFKSKFTNLENTIKQWSENVHHLYDDPYKTKSDLSNDNLSKEVATKMIKTFEQEIIIGKEMKECDEINHNRNLSYLSSVTKMIEDYIANTKKLLESFSQIQGMKLYIDNDIEDAFNKFYQEFLDSLSSLEIYLFKINEEEIKNIVIEGTLFPALLNLNFLTSKITHSIGKV